MDANLGRLQYNLKLLDKLKARGTGGAEHRELVLVGD